MKLTLAFTAALLACATTSQAQSASVGVKAGVNVAGLSFSSKSDPASPTSLTGLVVGVFATMPINVVVSFQPEALVSQQGAKFTNGNGGGMARIQIDYIQVPLLGRFRLMPLSPIAVLVGPSLGFAGRAKFMQAGQPDQDFRAARFDAGVVAGLALDVAHLVLDGRYTWGLRNVAPNGISSASEAANNRVASMTVGFKF
jgi:hypothetical protein